SRCSASPKEPCGTGPDSPAADGLIPRMSDVPLMHIEVISTDNPPTGVGQMATPLVTPAIGNAIAQLTGTRLRHAPFTSERVKKPLA
ncbi:MAG TPA: hypothetical protein VFR54_09835, partial [Xanthobacteraceae bacterium]|nr:hypothetical protein [Xanthobacteraceae bacterium]